MKEKIIRIFVNAIVGAVSSALALYLGAGAAEAIGTGAASSATVGDFAADLVSSTIAVST